MNEQAIREAVETHHVWATRLPHDKKACCDSLTTAIMAIAEKPRMFPVIPTRITTWEEDQVRPHPMTIPWRVAELAYSKYVGRHGADQSLERLAERGGFHAQEMDELLPDWRERCAEKRETPKVRRIQIEDAISVGMQTYELENGTRKSRERRSVERHIMDFLEELLTAAGVEVSDG